MLLDHIVHFSTRTPKKVVEDWKQKGFHAVVGGQHIQWGTHNALLYTKNSYIEWLAIENRDVATNSNHPLVNLLLHDLEAGPGYGTICIRTNNMKDIESRLKGQGVKTSGILQAERKTANGQTKKWEMLFVQEEVNDSLPTPFFIQWEEEDERRLQSLQEDGMIQRENLQQSIVECEFHVHNPRNIMDKWKSYFGLEEIEEGILLLGKTKLTFKQSGNLQRERLVSVYIEGHNKKEVIKYEQATYRFV